jgi:Flp pilus assembly protein TadD/preprotein translocase subunit Sec61beta
MRIAAKPSLAMCGKLREVYNMKKTPLNPRYALSSNVVLALFVSLVVIFSHFFAPPAQAQTASLDDIADMISQRQYAPALTALAPYLEANPADAHARFLKGVALNEMNRTSEAIAVFTALTEDYPELPEPYNNLAVIYAKLNQLDNARMALEMAIRTHPSYAIAHENLGDIYARLARESYSQADKLAPGNPGVQKKLGILKSISPQ